MQLKSAGERQQFITQHSQTQLKRPVNITAMTTLKKNSLNVDAIDTLVVTTECARVLVVDVTVRSCAWS
jgi:hypothetical protein